MAPADSSKSSGDPHQLRTTGVDFGAARARVPNYQETPRI